MRLSTIRNPYGGRLRAAVLTVAAAAATARAQGPPQLPGEMPSPSVVAYAEEPSETGESPESAPERPSEEAPADSPETPFGGPFGERAKFTGDWLGLRSLLRDGGVTFDFSTTQFYQGVTAGGLDRGFQYGGRNDYFLNIDAEKLGLARGTSVALHAESRYGETANSIAGSLAGPNLMLAFPLSTGWETALTGVTFARQLTDDLQVYAGKLNTLDGYQQPLTGADNLSGFQNTAMLYNPVFARTIPYSTFGAGFDWTLGENSSASVIVYDTNDTPTVSGFDTFFNNGATIYVEWNRATDFFDRPGNQGISGTYSTGSYTDLAPTAYLDPIVGPVIVVGEQSGSWSLAYNFDQALYVSPEEPERVWGVFGSFGIADENPSPVRWFASAGIGGSAGIAGRTADSFGIAYYYLGVSDPLKNLAPLLLPLGDEQGVEIYYNVAVNPWFQVSPDLQVIRPFRGQAETSLLVGLRAKIDF